VDAAAPRAELAERAYLYVYNCREIITRPKTQDPTTTTTTTTQDRTPDRGPRSHRIIGRAHAHELKC
jgi:hypothetical protein